MVFVRVAALGCSGGLVRCSIHDLGIREGPAFTTDTRKEMRGNWSCGVLSPETGGAGTAPFLTKDLLEVLDAR